MIVIGLVGTPAGGKSTVARLLQELGATWINADLIAREVLDRADVQKRVIDHFGPDVADNAGLVDRKKLAARVFGDDDLSRRALRYLEGLVHPLTRQVILQRMRDVEHQHPTSTKPVGLSESVVVLDIPLLFEAGWDVSCDQIWCVDADHEIRAQRAADRGWDSSELKRREANQLAIDAKKRLSSVVVDNNGSPEQLNATITALWSSLR
ncbi:MAG: dephospho-CoA kinase [Planctomycetota bacterium]